MRKRVAKQGVDGDDYSIADVRRRLHEIRRLWRANAPATPFFTSARVDESGTTAAEFAYHFVLSHHRKRRPTTHTGEAEDEAEI